MSEKLDQPSNATTDFDGCNIYRRLLINDRLLVDTGADISVLPPSKGHRIQHDGVTTFAANGTRISTYRERALSLDLGLRRTIRWIFKLADVPFGILGANVLHKYAPCVDFNHKKLIDSTTALSTKGLIREIQFSATSTCCKDRNFSHILKDCPGIFWKC